MIYDVLSKLVLSATRRSPKRIIQVRLVPFSLYFISGLDNFNNLIIEMTNTCTGHR